MPKFFKSFLVCFLLISIITGVTYEKNRKQKKQDTGLKINVQPDIIVKDPIIIKDPLSKKDCVVIEHLYGTGEDSVFHLVVADSMMIKKIKDAGRYFLISYTVSGFNETLSGTIEIQTNNSSFPSKEQIDNFIYRYLEYKKDCYQGIIINSVFEFNNKEDFDSFGGKGDYKGFSKREIRKHKDCREEELKLYNYRPKIDTTWMLNQ